MQSQLLAILTITLSSLILSGCIATEEETDATNNDQTKTAEGANTIQMSGVVVDGYIENAKVCHDLNGNFACDADEPSTTTDSDGKYTLETSSENQSKHPVIAEVSTNSLDKDDNGASVSEPYLLTTPIGSEAAITPLTTLAKGQMDAVPTLTKEQAEHIVLNGLALYDNNEYSASIYPDYIPLEGNDTNYQLLHNVARLLVKETTQYQKALKENNINIDNATGVVNQQVMSSAIHNLGAFKQKVNDSTLQSEVNLELIIDQNAFDAATLKSQLPNEKVHLPDFMAQRLVEFGITRKIEDAKMNIIEIGKDKRLNVGVDPSPTKNPPPIADFNESIKDVTLHPRPGYRELFNRQFAYARIKKFDLANKKLRLNDLLNPLLTSKLADDLYIDFASNDYLYLITNRMEKHVQLYPDTTCVNDTKDYGCKTEVLPHDTDIDTFILNHNSKDNPARGHDGDNLVYFKPTDTNSPSAGGELWRHNLNDGKDYYFRNYKVIQNQSNDYLVWGQYQNPFQDIVQTYDANAEEWIIMEYPTREGSLTLHFFNTSAGEKILTAIKQAISAKTNN